MTVLISRASNRPDNSSSLGIVSSPSGATLVFEHTNQGTPSPSTCELINTDIRWLLSKVFDFGCLAVLLGDSMVW